MAQRMFAEGRRAIPGGILDSERLLSLNLIDGMVLAGKAPDPPPLRMDRKDTP